MIVNEFKLTATKGNTVTIVQINNVFKVSYSFPVNSGLNNQFQKNLFEAVKFYNSYAVKNQIPLENFFKIEKGYFRGNKKYGRTTKLIEIPTGRVVFEAVGISKKSDLLKQINQVK